MFSDNEFQRFVRGEDMREKAIEGMKAHIDLLGTYFTTLKNVGFTEAEALDLTKSYQQIVLNFAFLASAAKNADD